MNTEEDIFEAAAALPAAERSAFLENACAGQPELRARLEALLRSHEVSGFMEENAVAAGSPELFAEWPEPRPEQSGERMGHYKLLEKIGEGGFGVVWVAEQEQPVRRRVALKIIKPGMDSREVIARFGQERQALAMMDHPNIAKVFDAGATDKGRPFFVMELVQGVKMTEYCDEANLPLADRLRLFITVCQAVQHAHQKGIIHRDLKPSNILVAPGDDGTPAPKVIDFGVAKAMQQPLTDDTVYTQFEQMIGTPAYMSPEQAGLGPMDIDTRSDVYSLGVLLYELLTGRPPFDPKELLSAGPDEMRRVIREVEPPKPSTRLTQLKLAIQKSGGTKSALRTPHSAIDQDLDWIVMKALEKDRARRYETANGLAGDIQRFLNSEPVSAGPPSAVYRLRKFVRRNKRTVTAGLLILASSIAGFVGTGIGLFRARHERDVAQDRLYDSLLGEARATHLARMDGYRPRVFSLLRRASQLEISKRNPQDIRQQAIDCLGDFVGLSPVTIDGIPSQISAIGLHPQSSLIAAGLIDGTILLYDIATSDERARLSGHRSAIVGLEFNSGGLLTTVDSSGAVITWQQQEGKWVSTNTRQITGSISRSILAADSRRLAAVYTGGVAVWNLDTGQEIGHFPEIVRHIGLSNDGKLLAASHSKMLTVFDTESRKLRHFAPEEFGPIGPTAFNADSSLMAIGCDEGLVVLELPAFGQRMSIRSSAQNCVAFHPSRPLLATSSINSQIRLWNVATNREEAVVEFSGSGNVRRLTFRHDGNLLAAAKDNAIRVWTLGGTAERLLLAGHQTGVTCSEFSPDGARLATGGKDRKVRIWAGDTGRLLQTLDGFSDYVQTLAFDRGGQLLATGDYDGHLKIWNLKEGRIIAQPDHPLGEMIFKVAFSPDGRFLAAAGNGMHIWSLRAATTFTDVEPVDFAALKLVARVGGSRSLMLSFSPDSSRIGWINQDNRICIWDVAGAKPVQFTGPNALRGWQALAFLPDSNLLAYVSNERMVQIWDIAADRGAFTLGNQGDFTGWHVAVSPDGNWLVGESSATTPVLWNLRTRRRLLTFPQAHSPLWTFAWSPYSDNLAIGLSDGSLSIWQLPKIQAILDDLGLGWAGDRIDASAAATGRPDASVKPEKAASNAPASPDLPLLSSLSQPGIIQATSPATAAERSAAALKLHEEGLSLKRKTFGPEHAATLMAMNNLAPHYAAAGRLDDAIKLGEELLTLHRKVNGPEHSATLDAMNNQATFYSDAGRPEDALKLSEEVLTLRRKVDGPDHPDTFRAMINLADSYYAARRWDEALKLREEGLALGRGVLGPSHPDTLISMGGLSDSYAAANRMDEALKLREERLTLSREANGPKHSDTLDAMQELARFLGFVGRKQEALKLREDVLKFRRDESGPYHPRTLSAMTNLAVSYRNAKRLEEAIPLQEEALTLKRRFLRAGHPHTLVALKNLAECYAAAGRKEEADALKKEAEELRRGPSGPALPETRGEERPRENSEADPSAGSIPATGRTSTAPPVAAPAADTIAAADGTAKPNSLPRVRATLVAPDSEWKWLHPLDGKDPEQIVPAYHESFRQAGFDDSKWTTGKDSDDPNGGFGYDFSFAGVDIGKPEEMSHRRTAYFRHAFKTTKAHRNLELCCRRDDGIIVYLDGKEVVRDNMEAGPESYQLAATATVDGADEQAVQRFPVPGVLAPGSHTLAISVHNTAQPSSDLRLGGVTLVDTTPAAKQK